jgi:hypothetical protein
VQFRQSYASPYLFYVCIDGSHCFVSIIRNNIRVNFSLIINYLPERSKRFHYSNNVSPWNDFGFLPTLFYSAKERGNKMSYVQNKGVEKGHRQKKIPKLETR